MDKPIFTLHRPTYIRLVVSEDGQWTAILTTRGIELYDHNGQLVSQYEDPLTGYNGRYPIVLIAGNELLYHNCSGMVWIFSIPGLTEVGTFDLSHKKIHYMAFNKSWIIYLEHEGSPLAIERTSERAEYTIWGIGVPQFLEEHIVFVPSWTSGLPKIHDLQLHEDLRNLPWGVSDVTKDRRYCIGWGRTGTALILDYQDGSWLGEVAADQPFLFCHDSKHLITRVEENRYFLYEIESRKLVSDLTTQQRVTGTGIPPDHRSFTFAQMESDGWVRRYDLLERKFLHKLVHLPGYPNHMAVSGQYLAMMSDHIVTVFNTDLGEVIWQKESLVNTGEYPHDDVAKVAIHKTWITVQSEKSVDIWDFKEDRIIASCPGRVKFPVLTSKHLYFTGFNDQKLRKRIKFDVHSNIVLLEHDGDEYEPLHLSDVYGLIVGATDKTVMILDPDTFKEKWRVNTPTNYVMVVGDCLAYDSGDIITFSSLEDNRVLFEIKNLEANQGITLGSANSDGSIVVSISRWGKQIHFWRPGLSTDPVYSINMDVSVRCTVFAGDRTLVTSHMDGTVNFWDITHITQRLV